MHIGTIHGTIHGLAAPRQSVNGANVHAACVLPAAWRTQKTDAGGSTSPAALAALARAGQVASSPSSKPPNPAESTRVVTARACWSPSARTRRLLSLGACCCQWTWASLRAGAPWGHAGTLNPSLPVTPSLGPRPRDLSDPRPPQWGRLPLAPAVHWHPPRRAICIRPRRRDSRRGGACATALVAFMPGAGPAPASGSGPGFRPPKRTTGPGMCHCQWRHPLRLACAAAAAATGSALQYAAEP